MKRMTERQYWPNLLRHVEKWQADGKSDSDISQLVEDTFGLRRQSFRIAVRRGDVPTMLSGDRARAEAQKRGDITFDGKPCVNCNATLRYVADLRCVACDQAYNESTR